MLIKVADTAKVEKLFGGWQETMIWSCLQNVMGTIYADREFKSAAAVLGDFAFFAGVPSESLLSEYPVWCDREFMILVPQNKAWEELIERVYGEKAEKTIRYAIKKENDCFDKERLLRAAESLAEGYSLRLLDKELYEYCQKTEWSEDLVAQYADYETYERLGLGVMVLKDNVPVAGAASYTSYQGGIEVEIDTKKAFRRQGLAYACGAKLILECLNRGLYPSWDAQNKASVALAEKLGYHFDCEYTVFEFYKEGK